jgi:TPR repeat protein
MLPARGASSGVSKAEQEVAALKEKAAEADSDPRAQVQLGTAYASGDDVTEDDDTEAVKWFGKAAHRLAH